MTTALPRCAAGAVSALCLLTACDAGNIVGSLCGDGYTQITVNGRTECRERATGEVVDPVHCGCNEGSVSLSASAKPGATSPTRAAGRSASPASTPPH
jgi:hypothetical protein